MLYVLWICKLLNRSCVSYFIIMNDILKLITDLWFMVSLQRIIVKLVFKNIPYYSWIWLIFLFFFKTKKCESFLMYQPDDQPNSIKVELGWIELKKNKI